MSLKETVETVILKATQAADKAVAFGVAVVFAEEYSPEDLL